ncbi:MAG: long-chain fatty acid--CoA ligase [Candidatus Velthaea sp.]|jgi:long-chain acyl-CoA synthetase
MTARPQTLIALFADVSSGPDRAMLAQRDADGIWVITGSHALRERVAAAALGLRQAGIGRGDRVAIMSPNRVDWIVANLAIIHAGAVVVPLYATQAHDQVRHILDNSEARLMFVDSTATCAALRAAGIELPHCISFDPDGSEDLAMLETAGREALVREPEALAVVAAQAEPDELAMLIYTSGTTGQPKGVMLSHRNIASNAEDAFAILRDIMHPGDAVLSILPYAHIYESTNVYGYFLRRSVVYVNTNLDRLLEDLRSVQPVMVLAVPRVFERVLVALVSKAKQAGGLRARVVPWALATGRDYMRMKAAGKAVDAPLALRYRVAYALALGKIRPALGLQQLRFFGSGSAPLHPDTALTFLGFGAPITEGYGLTECSPVVTTNSPRNPRIGTVGPAIRNVEVKLAEDGELLVRGPGVMKGYYHDHDATARAITDGWLHTGDIATIRADGCVRIVDRKNELFKTSGGKFIAPGRIESAMLRSIYFNQVMVFGAGRPHPAALVSPNWNSVRSELHLSPEIRPVELAARRDVLQLLQREAQVHTSDLAPFEHIRTIGVLPRDLTIEAGELSPTQKIRRRVVERLYAGLIEAVMPAVA